MYKESIENPAKFWDEVSRALASLGALWDGGRGGSQQRPPESLGLPGARIWVDLCCSLLGLAQGSTGALTAHPATLPTSERGIRPFPATSQGFRISRLTTLRVGVNKD